LIVWLLRAPAANPTKKPANAPDLSVLISGPTKLDLVAGEVVNAIATALQNPGLLTHLDVQSAADLRPLLDALPSA
jgi:hypothetical protein